jgi:hypothetical protein
MIIKFELNNFYGMHPVLYLFDNSIVLWNSHELTNITAYVCLLTLPVPQPVNIEL